MTDTTNPQQAVEERVARHLASKDWLTTPDRWDQGSAWFRADYLAHAREVIALVQAAATVPASAPADRAAAPTAWAYEQACTALNRHRDLAEVRRLALSAALRLGTGAPWETIRDRAAELAALPEPANRAAIRAAALREAADFVGNDDDCDCGGCDTCLPRKLAAELRRMAVEEPASGPGGAAGEVSSYADRVNAPLSESTITALRKRLASGDVPVRTVRRRVAGETQQPETCGRTWSVGGDEYPPCARPVDHWEAYCRSEDGQSLFIGAADEQSAAVSQPECTCDPAPHREDDGTYSHWTGCPIADAQQADDAAADPTA
jgi:hypothetical protein